jgi:hypothetical protein
METVMLFREHRGGLAESLDTEVQLTDRAALVAHVSQLLDPFGFKFDDRATPIKVEYYGKDHRIAVWKDTYVVTLAGYGVLGFTNAPCSESDADSQHGQ